MRTAVLLFMAAGLALASCRTDRQDSTPTPDAGAFLPATIGAVSLEHPEAFPPDVRDAAAAAAARLVREGKNPALSYVQFAKLSDDEVVVHVWPASMFGGKRPHGGGGRSLYFSRRVGKIVRGVAWQ